MKKFRKICIMMLVGILMATMLTSSVNASPWSQGGNNIGSATAMGSTDSYDVYFITGNTEAMRIDTNQRIGIADSTPDFRLEVATSSGSGYFGVSSLAGNDGNVFIIDSSGDVGIGTANPDNKLTVSGDADFTGSVGIGTASPSYKLDVKAWSVVGPCIFQGADQDDMTPGGTYLGSEDLAYVVEIDGTGTPDTFKWSDDGGSTWDETGVEITGSAQSLNYGVTVTFAATTGHTLEDRWTFETEVTNPFSVQNAAGDQVFYINNDGKVSLNLSGIDYALEVNGDVWLNSSIVKFGNSSLSTHSDADKNSYMGTQFVRIIFDADNSANDYYFAVGAHEDKRKNTPAYATSELFWIREDGKTGIGAQSPLGRLWVNTEPTTGEGTIETFGTDVTGTSTLFEDELMIGSEIWIEVSHGPKPWDQQKEIRRVVAIISDTEIDIDSEFSQDIPSGTNFKYSRPILCVENNERVGISTISPTESLDVNGKARVRNLDGYESTDTIVTADSTGVLHDSGETIGGLKDHDWYEELLTEPPDDIGDNIWTNGNVGIGTNSPNAKLDVRGDAIFNEDQGDYDFRIEGNGDANLFFVDAGNDRIGIGTSSPRAKLDVTGANTQIGIIQQIIEPQSLTDIAPYGWEYTGGPGGGGTLNSGGSTQRGYDSYWQATQVNQYVEVHLGQNYDIKAIAFGTNPRTDGNSVPKDYEIEYLPQPGSWTTFVTVTENTNIAPVHIADTPFTATRIRITITAFQGGQSQSKIAGLQILQQNGSALAGKGVWALKPESNKVFFATIGNVGIGISDPGSKLDVRESKRTTNMLDEEVAIFARNDYPDTSTGHIKAIVGRAEGDSVANTQYAYGVFGRSWNWAANGNTGYSYGVYGYANGETASDHPANTMWNYAVYGNAVGSGAGNGNTINIGIYGTASSGDTNYAGYFTGANTYINGLVVDSNGYLKPISSTDAVAPNNSIYYSTTQSKLVYKDSVGTANNLY
ncbi:discoidin domain-containing protein [Candidatus Pacearchaeota archaeon]|nr:discoidin domain-containing protein [Candidatus Pacearchaeota archaeon]